MELKSLKYFLKIIEEKSVSKAAESLHLVQPALTRQLKALEEELGVILINRTTRKFQVTEAGELLAHRARQMLDLEQTIAREIQDLREGVSGTIRIGTIGSEMERLLPEAIMLFSSHYPEIRFKSIETSSFEVMDLLDKGLIDVGFVRTPIELNSCICKVLPANPMVIATVGEVFWNVEMESLTYESLRNQPLIVHNRFTSVIEKGCRAAGFEPFIRASVEDTRSLLLLASKGIGTAIVQQDWLGMMPQNWSSIVLADPALMTETAVVWSKENYLSKVAQKFIFYLTENLQNGNPTLKDKG